MKLLERDSTYITIVRNDLLEEVGNPGVHTRKMKGVRHMKIRGIKVFPGKRRTECKGLRQEAAWHIKATEKYPG